MIAARTVQGKRKKKGRGTKEFLVVRKGRKVVNGHKHTADPRVRKNKNFSDRGGEAPSFLLSPRAPPPPSGGSTGQTMVVCWPWHCQSVFPTGEALGSLFTETDQQLSNMFIIFPPSFFSVIVSDNLPRPSFDKSRCPQFGGRERKEKA